MARRPRVVATGVPHHVTQRGNDRRDIFLHDRDRAAYLETPFEYSDRYQLAIFGYCLMTNHVHFVVVPHAETSLARVFGRTHSDYARYANILRRGCGHLWQARFYSCPLDEASVWQALAYVERNPVRAGIAASAEKYAWSSAYAHCRGEDPSGRLDMEHWRCTYTPERWREALRSSIDEEAFRERLHQATAVGLPLGDKQFVVNLSRVLGRDLEAKPVGRPPKQRVAAAGAK